MAYLFRFVYLCILNSIALSIVVLSSASSASSTHSAQNYLNTNTHTKSIAELIALADQSFLHKNAQWLRLLHFNTGASLHSKNTSYIKSPEFFFTQKDQTLINKINPQQELHASIRAFFGEDKNARCQFPARFQWLSKQLKPKESHHLEHCEELHTFKKTLKPQKVILIFPSSYIDSPASIFGHTLLRFDNDGSTPVLNWAVNYGALLSEQDGALAYARKGITGGYQGQYFLVPYAQKIKEYNHLENRDIWEFELNLDQEEINLLINHLWELKNINFDYYYFDENCAFRLLALIGVAKPKLAFDEHFRFFQSPIDSIKFIEKNHLITHQNFRPSLYRKLQHAFSELNSVQKKLAKKLALQPSQAEQITFKTLSQNEQKKILQAAFKYLRYKSDDLPTVNTSKNSLELLHALNSYPLPPSDKNILEAQARAPSPSFISKSSPLNTHHRRRISLGGTITDSEARPDDPTNKVSIEYRSAYHDFLDPLSGFDEGVDIQGPAIKADFSEEHSQIDALVIFNLSSLNPLDDLNTQHSWNIALEAQRSSELNEHLHSLFKMGGGFDWRFKGIHAYQLITPRIEHNPSTASIFDIGADIRLGLLKQSASIASQFEFKLLKQRHTERKTFIRYRQQVKLDKNHALRIQVESSRFKNNHDQSAALDYLYYF